MRILYQLPNPDTIYAGRTIYFGYKHAFEDLGHEFKTLTPDSNQEMTFQKYQPDIFITSINSLVFKYLDLDLVKKQKRKGMKVFVNVPFWKSPISKLRINETPSLLNMKNWVKLISSGNFGDAYFNICEQGDNRMDGFEKTTGYKHLTILLAADKTIIQSQYSNKFACDISFIGTYLPGKREFINKHVFPLMKKYKVKLYGRDWTTSNKILNFIQKVGQYFNIPIIKSMIKFKPTIEEERQIHFSSTIALNIHEDYQKRGLGDINERTFKIPASSGFEIVDNVPSLSKYFNEKELVIAENKKDWFDKIDYYVKNPQKRLPIIKAGKKKVLKEHTYHNRVKQIIKIYKSL